MNETRKRPSQLLRVGGKAPGFSLPDHKGTPVTVSKFSGKKNVVLVLIRGTTRLAAPSNFVPSVTTLTFLPTARRLYLASIHKVFAGKVVITEGSY